MTANRKRSFSGVFIEPEADEEPSYDGDTARPLSRKIRRCDSSADAASLLLLFSKQSAGQSTSEDSVPTPEQQQHACPRRFDTENFPSALLPPPSFETLSSEVSDGRARLKPLNLCILNFNDYNNTSKTAATRQESREEELEDCQPVIIGRPMAPAPRLPNVSTGQVIELDN